ncbi:hypothetical protein [Corynebacterium hadale]|uniref:hypothetical protein n=1 Tax=Corynebacterium hadale TaxID=2026255 RepID=UPI000BAA37FB|nr:hypothetical protein [Corynebacterium hadale]PAT13527.1 hypothetical protein CKJ83_01420 [Corynebacterium hadale]
MPEIGTLEQQARRYRPKRNPVTDDVAHVIQHVLLRGVAFGHDGPVRGIDTRKRLQTIGGLLARYLTSVKQVWGSVNEDDVHDLFNHDLVDWWVAEQVREQPAARHERSLLRLCWAWTSPDPRMAARELSELPRMRPFKVHRTVPESRPLTPDELHEVCAWLEVAPTQQSRERATFAVALTIGAGLRASQRQALTAHDLDPHGEHVRVDGELVPVRPEARAAVASLREHGISGASQGFPFSNMQPLGFEMKPTRLIDTWVVMQLCDGVEVSELEPRSNYAQICRAAIAALRHDTDYSDIVIPPLEGTSRPGYGHLRVVSSDGEGTP